MLGLGILELGILSEIMVRVGLGSTSITGISYKLC